MIITYEKFHTLFLSIAYLMLVGCGGSNSQDQTHYRDVVYSQNPIDQSSAEGPKNLLLAPIAGRDRGHDDLDYSVTSEGLPNINSNRNQVRFNRVISHSESFQHLAQAGFSTVSRRFKVATSARELSEGVVLPISSDAAVVRLVPMKGAENIDSSKLKIMKGGRWLSAEQAFDAVADKDTLNAVGLTSVKNTLAMRLKPSKEVSSSLQLKVDDLVGKSGNYLLHVVEPHSDKVLNMSVTNTKLKQGEDLHLELRLSQSEQNLPIHHVEGFILAPRESERIPVNLDIVNGKVNAAIQTGRLKTAIPGLWEVHVVSEHESDDDRLLRTAKVAFSLSPKTAKMGANVSMSFPSERNDGILSFDFDIEVALAGRYELSAVLYGTNHQGVLKPAISLSVASWLDASDTLRLSTSARELQQASISEPFELRHLVLKDQSRMAELWSQEYALANIQ